MRLFPRWVPVEEAMLNEVAVLCIEERLEEREGGGGGARRDMLAMVVVDETVDRLARSLGEVGVE